MTKRRFAPERMDRADWDEILDIRPLEDIGQKALGEDVPFIRKMLAHPCEDSFWLRGNWAKRSTGKTVPVLIQSGWFDDNGMGTTEALDLTAGYPPGTRKVVLGPCSTAATAGTTCTPYPFPPERCGLIWICCIRNGSTTSCGAKKTAWNQSAPVEYYTMGENRWKTASRWPVENADDTPFYFGENGTLFPICGREGRTGYTYDPQDPGTHIIDMSENEIAVPEDYTQEEQRPDYI